VVGVGGASAGSRASAIAISWCNRVDAERPEPAGEFRRAPVAGRDQLWELIHQALGELARGQDLRQLQPDEHQLMPDRCPLLVSPLIDRPETLTVTSRGLGATGHCASAGSDKANVSDSFGERKSSSATIPPFGCTACQARMSASLGTLSAAGFRHMERGRRRNLRLAAPIEREQMLGDPSPP
jgi:hypothetical protein